MESQSPPPIQSGSVQKPGSKWPKTLGIISIIFGIGGLLQAIMAPFSAKMTAPSMQVFVEQGADQGEVDAYLARLLSESYVNAGICLVLGALLLTGGILLLKRKTSSPLILQVWSVLKILGGGYILFRSAALQKVQMDIMFSNPGGAGGSEMEMIGNVTKYAMMGGMIFGFLWLAALPVFMLIWFNRQKIKTQISEW